MSLETLLIAKPNLTRAIGWGFIVVFGIGAALFGWKYSTYPTEPEPLTVAEAITRLAGDPEAELWLTLSDLDPAQGQPLEAPAEKGDSESVAFVRSECVLVVSFYDELGEAPSGELRRSSPRRVAHLQKRFPKQVPEEAVVYGMTTWGGPDNMLAGVALMGGFMAFGPLFLLIAWKARRDAERVRREGFDWIDSTTEARVVGGGFLLLLGALALWMPIKAIALSVIVVPLALLNLWAPAWLRNGYDDMSKSTLSVATGIPWTPPERRSLLQWWRDRKAARAQTD